MGKEQQSNLFKGLKFFLGREVPREPLVFMIRAVGGEVSWDSSVGVGATFPQSDSTITHQVMDRDAKTAGDLVLGRFYIQPQWIFDSINKREKGEWVIMCLLNRKLWRMEKYLKNKKMKMMKKVKKRMRKMKIVVM